MHKKQINFFNSQNFGGLEKGFGGLERGFGGLSPLSHPLSPPIATKNATAKKHASAESVLAKQQGCFAILKCHGSTGCKNK